MPWPLRIALASSFNRRVLRLDVIESTFPLSVGLGNVTSAGTAVPSSPSVYYTTPTIRLPAHLHYFTHGCGTRYCCGKAPTMLRVPRMACGIRGGAQPIAGRILEVVYPGAPQPQRRLGDDGSASGEASEISARGRLRGGQKRGAKSVDHMGSARGGGAAAGGPSSPLVAAAGVLTALRYRVEWLSEAPLGHRRTSVVGLDTLCGGDLELVERCHAHRWIGASEAQAESYEGRRHRAASQRRFEALRDDSSERMGCGLDL